MGKHTYGEVCYGWFDNDYYVIIDYDSLEKLNERLRVYTTETNYGCHSDTVYGITCSFDSKTGCATLSDELKLQVENAYKLWCEKKGVQPKKDGVGFHTVISGEFDTRRETRHYTLHF